MVPYRHINLSSKNRIGSLSVQSFADTLKFKNASSSCKSIDWMCCYLLRPSLLHTTVTSQRSIGSFYQAGNNRDGHAGVGTIISPNMRPYLMDIIQVNNRIIHLGFKKQGDNIYVFGACAPHSKRGLELDRQPFWDN